MWSTGESKASRSPGLALARLATAVPSLAWSAAIARQLDAEVLVRPLDQARAVQPVLGVGAAEHVRDAEVLLGSATTALPVVPLVLAELLVAEPAAGPTRAQSANLALLAAGVRRLATCGPDRAGVRSCCTRSMTSTSAHRLLFPARLRALVESRPPRRWATASSASRSASGVPLGELLHGPAPASAASASSASRSVAVLLGRLARPRPRRPARRPATGRARQRGDQRRRAGARSGSAARRRGARSRRTTLVGLAVSARACIDGALGAILLGLAGAQHAARAGTVGHRSWRSLRRVPPS